MRVVHTKEVVVKLETDHCFSCHIYDDNKMDIVSKYSTLLDRLETYILSKFNSNDVKITKCNSVSITVSTSNDVEILRLYSGDVVICRNVFTLN